MNTKDDNLKKIDLKYKKIKKNLKNVLIIFSTQFIILNASSTGMIINEDKLDQILALKITSLSTIIPALVSIIEFKEIDNLIKEKEKILKNY